MMNNPQQSIYQHLPSGRPGRGCSSHSESLGGGYPLHSMRQVSGCEGGSITLSNLSIGYNTKDGRRAVMENINATLESGRLTCLIGSNGVGKSTLLRTLAAFQPKLGGCIYIKGKEITEYSNSELSRLIGVVLTSKPDVMNMTVREIVGLGRTPYTGFWGTLREHDKDIVEQSIEQVGIGHLASRMIGTLSDGERQKMMIAKALAQQTPVIILDEPTAFLDYPSKVETMQLLMRLSRESDKTIFMSTHDLELVLQTADTLWLMTRENGVNVGTPDELAVAGSLSAFIDRPGIMFDKAEKRIVISKS